MSRSGHGGRMSFSFILLVFCEKSEKKRIPNAVFALLFRVLEALLRNTLKLGQRLDIVPH
jgi:hypothetical protein